MKKFIGFILIALGVLFVTDVRADIGTVSENCINIVDDVGTSATFDIVEQSVELDYLIVKPDDTYIVPSFEKDYTNKYNLYTNAITRETETDVLEPPANFYKRNLNIYSWRNTAVNLNSNSSNLFKHRCQANLASC